MEKKAKPAKENRRNNEKRKEKSRDAARCRRSKETEIFTDLANSLPLQKDQISQLDKASIMRLAISYLRVRDMINLVPQAQAIDKNVVDESVFLKSLEGFLLVLSTEGDFIYLSENVSDYLGIPQIDLMGQNVFDYSHPCDHEEIKDMILPRRKSSNLPKSFFIRLKCTLTSKGRSVNIKSATYKVIHCVGHVIKSNSLKTEKDVELEQSNSNIDNCFFAVGQPIPHPSNIEAPLGSNTFLSKHSLDMKFTYADDIMMDFLGYSPEDLLDKSVYEYHHAMDSQAICGAFKCLFSKGQCETNRYRFLAKTGGYVWVLTQATLIYDKMRKPQSVVCVNYVISGIECKDEIYSYTQALAVKTEEVEESEVLLVTIEEDQNCNIVEPSKGSSISNSITVVCPEEVSPPLVDIPIPPRPQTATSKLFAPRTEEMNKGFLMFSDEEPGLTMLKDEPDDLTHLAPVAGDVCVPLEDNPFLSDMLDDFLLRDNFSPLLTDEPSDPFISYRDSCNVSPQMLSPNISKHSDSSLPSLNSPGGSLGDEDHMSTFMTLQMEEEEPELSMKAPYIPMHMGDDLPLLMSDDYTWNTGTNEKISKNPDINSSLAQLLCSNKQSFKSSDRGGGLINNDVLNSLYNDKILECTNWNLKTTQKNKERSSSNKRSSSTLYDTPNKRSKNEPKEKMSSELLQQLMSNNTQRGHPKGKGHNWLIDSGQKATCISQPSESVLMNLLEDSILPTEESNVVLEKLIDQFEANYDTINLRPPDTSNRKNHLRKRSMSLLNVDSTSMSPFMDLTQQDFEVNAPVDDSLLQGSDLFFALEIDKNM